jgi:hypothetical protein
MDVPSGDANGTWGRGAVTVGPIAPELPLHFYKFIFVGVIIYNQKNF